MIHFEFLVIGSGVAGLVYALEVANYGKVAVITKNSLSDCNSDYAQGGIAAVLGNLDSFDNHIQDTYIAGAELGKIPVIRNIVQDGPNAIQYLIDKGTKFTPKNKHLDLSFENLSLTREGGHSQQRVAHAADSTGHEIMQALIKSCQQHKNIQIFENHIAVDLITQHHILQDEGFIPRITCWGAYVLDTKQNNIKAFVANKTMLATGGAGQVYLHNTNPEVATGDGIAMAKLAGARVANMEFVQFHPTAFHNGGTKSALQQESLNHNANSLYKKEKTFLVTEALRGEGAILRLRDGTPFMEKYHSRGNLAPRDIVARAIDAEIKKRDDGYVYLDATVIDHEKLKTHFPYIDKKCRKEGIDFTKDYIPVAPAAHYFCGGILTTVDGITDIQNLFAAGEVACTGLHGANRLASNSLLEAIVIAYRAAKHPSNLEKVEFPDIPEWHEIGTFNENEWVIIAHNREILKHTMQNYVGITRSRRLLKYAQNRVDTIYREIDNFYHHNSIRKEVIETRNMAIIARLIVQSALIRKESRGLHYLLDYPDRNDDLYKKDTII